MNFALFKEMFYRQEVPIKWLGMKNTGYITNANIVVTMLHLSNQENNKRAGKQTLGSYKLESPRTNWQYVKREKQAKRECYVMLLSRSLCAFTKRRPTKRAPDAGDSAQISGSFTRLIIFLAGRLRRPRPSAGNANRWAAPNGFILL